jgi:hypothetical protein
VELGIFSPGENVKITPYQRPIIKYSSREFFSDNIQAYLLSFNLISVFNNIKIIKLVVNNYNNYTLQNFTPGDESLSSSSSSTPEIGLVMTAIEKKTNLIVFGGDT